jgi:hypothetical protein
MSIGVYIKIIAKEIVIFNRRYEIPVIEIYYKKWYDREQYKWR